MAAKKTTKSASKAKKVSTKKTAIKKVKEKAVKAVKAVKKVAGKAKKAEPKKAAEKVVKKVGYKSKKAVKTTVKNAKQTVKPTAKKTAKATKEVIVKAKTKKENVVKAKKATSKQPKNKPKKVKQIIPMSARKIELPKNYSPKDKEDYMSDNQLEYFRLKLLDWKQELLKESSETLNHLQAENWNEPDPSDQATIVEQTGLELRTRDRYRKLIGKIDSALMRIDEGEYGYCEITGEPIGLKRLEARPIATMTIAAQEQHEDEEKSNLED